MKPADPEVLVVGGGPAGSATALILARAGRDVLLVDRAHFPRAKPCGECVSPGAVAILDRLGVTHDVRALGPARLDGWRVRTPSVDVAARFGKGLHGLGISRAAFDATLLDAARRAGARVEEGVRVENLALAREQQGRPRVELRMAASQTATLRPRVVVGADGLRSVVARSIGAVARAPRLRKVSLTGRLRWETPHDGIGLLDVAHGATLGIAPVEGGLWNATVVTLAGRHGRRLARGARGFLDEVLGSRLGTSRGWEVVGGPWASGPFDWPGRRAFAPGVVLVGDAAGYYDPFTGQGIYRALRTAELAAAAVRQSLAVSDAAWEPLASYDRRWRREVRASSLVQWAVEEVMTRPFLRDGALRRLAASGGLPALIRVTGDATRARTLLRPSAWIGTRRYPC